MRGFWVLVFVIGVLVARGTAREPVDWVTSVAELRALSLEEADQQLPVRLRGVITYAESGDFHLIYVQDDTGGTFVDRGWRFVEPEGFDRELTLGDLVEIEAVTSRGLFIPHPEAGDGEIRARFLGKAPLPEPIRLSPGNLFQPRYHNQWVEVEAYCSGVSWMRRWLRLDLVAGGQRFRALVPHGWREADVKSLEGSDLRLRGVYGARFSRARELRGFNVLTHGFDQVEVVDAGLEKAFSQPVQQIRQLLRFQPGTTNRARVKGTVTFVREGRGFYLGDGNDAVWVELAGGDAWPEPGEAIEVVGFPAIGETDVTLQDASYRRGGEPIPGALEPRFFEASAALESDPHGQWVSMEARVVERVRLPHVRVLLLDGAGVRFEVRLEPGRGGAMPGTGSWVSVSGVFERRAGGERPGGVDAPRFQLLAGERGSIRILQRPSWWTRQRVGWLAGGLGLSALVSLAWVATLRRRVREQTAVLAEQIERQRIAEERARIGRELHDTLEQHLTGVRMQIEAAVDRLPSDGREVEPVRKTLRTASAMLEHSRKEARRSVWDLRSPVLEREGLPGALEELAASASAPGVNVRFEAPPAWERLEGRTEFHLLRIAQEAVANALKHGGASNVTIDLDRTGAGELTLRVRDDGCGFDEGSLPPDGEMHFGLAGMRERAGRIGARLVVDSVPGRGVEVSVRMRLLARSRLMMAKPGRSPDGGGTSEK